MTEYDKELDTSGLNCPLPIIKAKKEINLIINAIEKQSSQSNLLMEIQRII